MAKTTRGPRFIRIMWSFFIVLMAITLTIATCLLVIDFLVYDVSVYRKEISRKSAFPAITICHHHPFSNDAYALWRNKSIISPSQFNNQVRQVAQKLLGQRKFENLNQYLELDSIKNYYQSLSVADAQKLGHNPRIIFLNCVRLTDAKMDIVSDCTTITNYSTTLYSHDQYFNCYTLQPSTLITSLDTEFLSIVVSLGPKPDYQNTEQAFLRDIFEQAEGVRVAVHEQETLPDMDTDGINVEPGKYIHISYSPHIWFKKSTPLDPCLHEFDYHFKDLNKSFIQTFSDCLKIKKQKRILSECKCLSALYPRIEFPNVTHPYCRHVSFDFNKLAKEQAMVKCAERILSETPSSFYDYECPQRCDYIRYENTVSVTKWRITNWQMYWLRYQLHYLQQILSKLEENNYLDTEDFRQMNRFLKWKNLSDISNQTIDMDLSGNNFAYIVLRRKTDKVSVFTEKLVLTKHVLLSQIGGFCSLLIGLSAAFIVEVIEFLYLWVNSDKTLASKKSLVSQREVNESTISADYERERPNGMTAQQKPITSSFELAEDIESYRAAATFNSNTKMRDSDNFMF